VNQSFTVNIDEVIMHVLSREAVMLTAAGNFVNFPAGLESRDIPLVCTHLFEKKEGKWVMTLGHESSTEKLTPEGRIALDSEIARELDCVWQDYISASNSGDLDKTMTFLTEDYVNMPGYGSTQTGKEETRVFFKDLMDNLKLKVKWYKQSEVFVHGDMAYSFGSFEITRAFDGKSVSVPQRCITVFKKGSDGKWRMYRWMGQD
jgi:ketosteroid isomerase-like protein